MYICIENIFYFDVWKGISCKHILLVICFSREIFTYLCFQQKVFDAMCTIINAFGGLGRTDYASVRFSVLKLTHSLTHTWQPY